MNNLPTKRVYYHYTDLEEYHAGMWKIYSGAKRKRFIKLSAQLMKRPMEFEAQMNRAIQAWPKSCIFNFTAPSVNKIAWLGHAGCCYAHGASEESTRAAWHTLNQEEQDGANQAATVALAGWSFPDNLGDQLFLL